jgi:L-aminopeptidase/D-esterase-like protein
MQCLGFKGGIGTASRRLSAKAGGFMVGVLVQCNFGLRRQLRIAGIPVGQEIDELDPCYVTSPPLPDLRARRCPAGAASDREHGSIIVIIGTDAPLLPHQLKRVARRASLGIGRMGGIAGSSSGDLFLAFSTASMGGGDATGVAQVRMLQDERIDPVYEATVQATEEAIVNALLAAKTMTGADDLRVSALPHQRVRSILQQHGRLNPTRNDRN